MIGGQFENDDQIAGIRLLDKSSAGRESNFRIEVWTKFNSQKSELVEQLRKHLESEYVQSLIDNADTHATNRQIDRSNPTEWLKPFSNHESSSDTGPRGDRGHGGDRGDRHRGDREDRGPGGNFKAVSGPSGQ